MRSDTQRRGDVACGGQFDAMTLTVVKRKRMHGEPFAACDGQDGGGVESAGEEDDGGLLWWWLIHEYIVALCANDE